MTAENSTRKRWLVAGCVLTIAASAGLCAFPLLSHLSFLGDSGVFSLACVLVIVMGLGATLAVFSVKRP